MKGFLVFLATIATAAAAGGHSPGLRVKFDVGVNFGGSFFFEVPKTVDEAVEEGWKRTRRPKNVTHLPQLVMYCPSDKVLCGFFDDTNYIAGLQVALAKAEFSDSVFDWGKRGFTSWNTAVNEQCKRFWTIQQYFVDEEYLSQNRAVRLAARERDPDRLLQAGAIWLTGIDKQVDKISTQQTEITESGFTEQACIPWMGLHHYYNMSSSTECTAEQMYPWFPLTLNGELIATGFMTFGKLELIDGRRDWFERPDETAVRTIVPHAPDCLYELSSDPGVVTMHIYYIDHPWLVLFC